MRRLLPIGVALVVAPAASAAPPAVQVGASPQIGSAPLEATLSATGDGASYRWEIDGAAAGEGAELRHVFPTGHHQVTVVARSASGEEARERVTVSAFALSLRGPRVAAYGRRITLKGRVLPPIAGATVALERDGQTVAHGRVRPGGRYAIGVRPSSPGSYAARIDDLASAALPIVLRPRLDVSVGGARLAGRPLVVRARVRPASAGSLRITSKGVTRNGSGRLAIRVRTRRPGAYAVSVATVPATGWAAARVELTVPVHLPRLGLGSLGASVAELERRLVELGYALPRVDRRYGLDTVEAVLAFQKVRGLPWTGRVNGRVWRALEHATRPRPRYARGNHVEVDKRRQLLLLVRNGRVVLVSHISTGATGNTPVGRWRVYRKVSGWDWILWYPMYFLRGFAIHGYPSVPAYPASHGCVRVPMWLAPRLYERNGYGTLVYVY